MVSTQTQVAPTLKFDPTSVVLPDNDMSFLTAEEVVLIGARREFVTTVPLVIARRLAEEQAVYIIQPNEIRMVFTRGNLRMFVLHRDSHTCRMCGRPANKVQRIIPKALGGLRTPANLRSLCSACINAQNDHSHSTAAGIYTTPIYVNDVGTTDQLVIRNAGDMSFKYISDEYNIHCFCDVSEHPSNHGTFGVAMVLTGYRLNSIRVYITRLHLNPGLSTVAEARAVSLGMQLSSSRTTGHAYVYTDTNFGLYRHPKNEHLIAALQLIGHRPERTKIVYLSGQGKKTSLYRLAHRYSRFAARQ